MRSQESLGSVNRKEVPLEFIKYVEKHRSEKALFVREIPNKSKLYRRYLLGNKIVHPSLNRLEFLINRLYVFPSDEYQKFEQDGSIVLCFSFKLQRRYSIPVVQLKTLSIDEVKVLELLSDKIQQNDVNDG